MKRGRLHRLRGVIGIAAASVAAHDVWALDGAGPASDTVAQATSAIPTSAVVPSETEAERAKQFYALGAEAFAAQKNAEAIRYFRRAAEIVPSSKLTYNIALAYEEMGDTGRALAEYRAYLRQEQGNEQRDEAEGRVRELERRLAETGVQQLSVSSSPTGATIRLGEHAVGVTPWSGELTPGTYLVTLELPGHQARHERIALEREHSAELRVALTPQPATKQEPPAPSVWRQVTPLTWSFLGVGLGGIAGGIGFELSRANSSERAERASSPVGAAEARGAADAKQMASLLLLGFGGGFLIGGGTLLVLDLTRTAPTGSDAPDAGEDHPEARVGLPCGPGFCGITALGNF